VAKPSTKQRQLQQQSKKQIRHQSVREFLPLSLLPLFRTGPEHSSPFVIKSKIFTALQLNSRLLLLMMNIENCPTTTRRDVTVSSAIENSRAESTRLNSSIPVYIQSLAAQAPADTSRSLVKKVESQTQTLLDAVAYQ